jgi:predicted nucleic acid-binding Zn ribbon protein
MSQGKLEFAWRSAVGPAIERATTVSLDDAGVLDVRTVDATWRREVRRSQDTILRRLQELLGPTVVKSIRVPGRGTRG